MIVLASVLQPKKEKGMPFMSLLATAHIRLEKKYIWKWFMFILRVLLVIRHRRDKLMRSFWADEWVHISNLAAWMNLSVILSCGLCATCVIKSVWSASLLLFSEKDECMPRAPVTLKHKCVYYMRQIQTAEKTTWLRHHEYLPRWYETRYQRGKLVLPLFFCDPAAVSGTLYQSVSQNT